MAKWLTLTHAVLGTNVHLRTKYVAYMMNIVQVAQSNISRGSCYRYKSPVSETIALLQFDRSDIAVAVTCTHYAALICC